jgi:hypothetical protein
MAQPLSVSDILSGGYPHNMGNLSVASNERETLFEAPPHIDTIEVPHGLMRSIEGVSRVIGSLAALTHRHLPNVPFRIGVVLSVDVDRLHSLLPPQSI